MKYIIVFCYVITTIKPVVYKKDLEEGASPLAPVRNTSTVCDSVKVTDADLANTLNSFNLQQVTIKSIRAVKK